jgi:hypothetical protein
MKGREKNILECEGAIVGEYTPTSKLGSRPEIIWVPKKSDGYCGNESEGRMTMA